MTDTKALAESHRELMAALNQAALELGEAGVLLGAAEIHGVPLGSTAGLFTEAAWRAKATLSHARKLTGDGE